MMGLSESNEPALWLSYYYFKAKCQKEIIEEKT